MIRMLCKRCGFPITIFFSVINQAIQVAAAKPCCLYAAIEYGDNRKVHWSQPRMNLSPSITSLCKAPPQQSSMNAVEARLSL
ncbi:hypothetical protein C8J56DRAFT_410374 [Mycena floridula]|nr:hypothetical protein C8J56DRAFT_410374 [Mycena floridula]